MFSLTGIWLFGSCLFFPLFPFALSQVIQSLGQDDPTKLSDQCEIIGITYQLNADFFCQEKRLTDEFEQINGEHLDYANRSVDVNSLRPAMTPLQVLAMQRVLTFSACNSGFTAGLISMLIQYVSQLSSFFWLMSLKILKSYRPTISCRVWDDGSRRLYSGWGQAWKKSSWEIFVLTMYLFLMMANGS